ncbi:MAG: hypothetical protein GY868_16460 [Deltaproteobacteria bacterium]|nr:hypothetical protein [Deltaproteobacteria bacterium]
MDLKKTVEKLTTGDDLKLVALGDSLTHGWMVERGYLNFLREKIAGNFPRSIMKIINRGIPGDTADGGLCRLKEHVLDSVPDLVFVQFGLNDAFSGCPVAQYRRNIEGIIDGIVAKSSAEILLMTSVALDGRDKELAYSYYDCLQSVAAQRSIPIVTVHEYWERRMAEGVLFESLVQVDRVHPTEDGYRLMAEAIVEVLCRESV